MIEVTVSRSVYGKYSYVIKYAEGEHEKMKKENELLAGFLQERVDIATAVRDDLIKKGILKKKPGRKKRFEGQIK